MGQSGKQRKARNQQKLELEERRKVVAANLLAGANYRDLASSLNVSVGTISGDFKAIIKEWRAHYARDADDWIKIHLRRLDKLLNTVWSKATADPPDYRAIDTALKIMERQARILGIDQMPDLHFNLTLVNNVAKKIKEAGYDPDIIFQEMDHQVGADED